MRRRKRWHENSLVYSDGHEIGVKKKKHSKYAEAMTSSGSQNFRSQFTVSESLQLQSN